MECQFQSLGVPNFGEFLAFKFGVLFSVIRRFFLKKKRRLFWFGGMGENFVYGI